MHTHRNVVIGVTILAILAMLVTFFAIGIVAIGMIDPPESVALIGGGLAVVTIDDYFSRPRVAGAFVVALFGAVIMWEIVKRWMYPLTDAELAAIDAEDDDL